MGYSIYRGLKIPEGRLRPDILAEYLEFVLLQYTANLWVIHIELQCDGITAHAKSCICFCRIDEPWEGFANPPRMARPSIAAGIGSSEPRVWARGAYFVPGELRRAPIPARSAVG